MSQENVDLDIPDADVGRGHEGFFRYVRRWSGEHSGLELERRDAMVYRIEGRLIVYLA
jgi:hypothetical protein